jgi:CRISPR-associated protein Cas2
MRSAYIVSYDISDPKRLRNVFKCLYGYGDHIQLSVFRCELTATDKTRLVARLEELIHHGEDQVLVVNIGPVPGRADSAVESVGRPFVPMERAPVVV